MTTLRITVTKEYMNKLKAEGILKRIGPDKGGHWEIVTPNTQCQAGLID